MIQTTNHTLVQLLLNEGARYYCNGGLINLHELICDKLNMPTKEAWELLLNCEICEKDKWSIENEIKECNEKSEIK